MKSVIKSIFKAGLFPALAIAAMVAAPCAWAQGTSFTYQGQLDDSGYVADGSYDMEFKIWNASSGGGQVGGTATFFAVPVDGGLFSQDLDFGSSVFTGPDRWLEISVKTNGVIGFITLSPRTKFTSAPYAIAAITAQTAASVPASSIGSPEVVNDSLTYKDLGPNSVGTSEVIDNSLTANDLAPNSVGASEIATDAVGTSEVANGSLTGADMANNTVGSAQLADSISLGSSGIDGELRIYSSSGGGNSIFLDGSDSYGGRLWLYSKDGQNGVWMAGGSGDAGVIQLYNTNGSARVVMDGYGTDGGGEIVIDEFDGSAAVELQASNGGKVNLNNGSGQMRALVDGQGYDSGGEVVLMDSAGVEVANLRASGGGQLNLYDGGGIVVEENDGTSGVVIGGGIGGYQRLYQSDGNYGIYLDGDSGGAGRIQVYDAAGSVTITLDGDYGGDGRIITDELEITGGSDLSEQFDIDGLSQDVEPGMIVCIDAANPGKLTVSSKAYDRKVAGVVSGANGVKPGLLMGQTGTVADGEYAVALTGRVYCKVDAGQGAIEPGDLITTSDVLGHGMRVADHGQAQGAIIGKAMTPLAEGQGLVLVLVSLQ